MPAPSSSLATLRPELGASFMEFDLEMNARGFIAHRVLPVIDVAVQAGTFGKIPIEQLLQQPDTKRAPGSAYNRGNWRFTTDSYATKENGHEEPLDDREVSMYRDFFSAEQITAARAFEFVLGAAERRVAALVFNTGNITNTTAVTNEWDDFANATPIDDVEAAVQDIYTRTGLWPTTLTISKQVFRNLRNCTQIINRLNSAGAGDRTLPTDINEQRLAEVFDLPEVLVGGSSKNTANSGQAASISPIWSNEYALIHRNAMSQDIREPCLGRCFRWFEDGDMVPGEDGGAIVETYRDETVRSDITRVRHDTDEKLIYAEAAHLLSNITT